MCLQVCVEGVSRAEEGLHTGRQKNYLVNIVLLLVFVVKIFLQTKAD